jgi:glycosyltransferase involved in cell wall biosynthesis
MATQSDPFLSVVIPVYNGAVTIGRALESLLIQDYPSDKYEIIAVNDGSTDATARVITNFQDVRYIEVPRNMGIPAAQNAGLEASKGDIYVAFNDDFQAAPDFLSQLARGYKELDRPIGIGGIVAKNASVRRKGLVANFIEANRDGAAPSITDVGPASLPGFVRRLLAYIVSNYSPRRDYEQEDCNHQEVVELYGANSSFPTSMLRDIGGWDTSTAAPAIGGIEDRDICYRLRQQFPDHYFYVVTSAHVMLELDSNDSSVSIKSYLLRPYRRGPFNYAFHVKNGLTPPLFPFPPFMLLMLLVGTMLAPTLLPLWIVLLPQLCYGWWGLRAIAERRPIYVLFSYLQAAEEAMVLAGLLKGFIMHTRGKLAIE